MHHLRMQKYSILVITCRDGKLRINPDFRIENFHFISMKYHFKICSKDHPFVSKVVIWVNICLK